MCRAQGQSRCRCHGEPNPQSLTGKLGHTSASAGAQPSASSSASVCGPAKGEPGLLTPWLGSPPAGPPAALPEGAWWCAPAAAACPLSGSPRMRATCGAVSGAHGSAQPRRAPWGGQSACEVMTQRSAVDAAEALDVKKQASALTQFWEGLGGHPRRTSQHTEIRGLAARVDY